jgi:hypothetical protein
MDVRMEVAPGINAEILTEHLQVQFVAREIGPDSFGSVSQVNAGNLALQLSHGFIPFLFDSMPLSGLPAIARNGFTIQFRAPVDLLLPHKNCTGKSKTGLLAALATIGLVEQLKYFHRVFWMRHMVLSYYWLQDTIFFILRYK